MTDDKDKYDEKLEQGIQQPAVHQTTCTQLSHFPAKI